MTIARQIGRAEKIPLDKNLTQQYVAVFEDVTGEFEFSAVRNSQQGQQIYLNRREIVNLLGAIADTTPDIVNDWFRDRYGREIGDYT